MMCAVIVCTNDPNPTKSSLEPEWYVQLLFVCTNDPNPTKSSSEPEWYVQLLFDCLYQRTQSDQK